MLTPPQGHKLMDYRAAYVLSTGRQARTGAVPAVAGRRFRDVGSVPWGVQCGKTSLHVAAVAHHRLGLNAEIAAGFASTLPKQRCLLSRGLWSLLIATTPAVVFLPDVGGRR